MLRPGTALSVPLAEGKQLAKELTKGTMVAERYRIAQAIGEGGVGCVFRAHDTETGKDVALKWLKPELTKHATLRPRFEREAKLLSSLSHPGIVLVTDYGEHEEGPFLVMELLKGLTLSQRARAGTLTVSEMLRVTRELLSTLAAVHGAGVMHRDIKPGNIFLQGKAGEGPVKLLDFGFARRMEATPDALQRKEAKLTTANTAFGTPSYMAPEQATVGEMDARTDLYAVGIILFEMITGAPPFTGEIPEVLRQHMISPVPQLAERVPQFSVAPALQALVERALAKRPDERFQTAEEMAEAVAALPEPCIRPAAQARSGAESEQTETWQRVDARPDGTMEVNLEQAEMAVSAPAVSRPPPLPSTSQAPQANARRSAAAPPPPPKTNRAGKASKASRPGSSSPGTTAAERPSSGALPPPLPAKASAKPPVPPGAADGARISQPMPPPPTAAKAPKPAKTAKAKQPAKAKQGAKTKQATKTKTRAKQAAAEGPSSPASPAPIVKAAAFIDGALDAERLCTTLQQQLRDKPDATRLARLHFELAALYEDRLNDQAQATKHYLEAAKRQPTHLPSVAGARRMLLRSGKRRESLEMLEREIALQAHPPRRAQLLWEKGQLVERTRGKLHDAMTAYAKGLELDPSNLDLLRATARLERSQKQWQGLDTTLGRMASRTGGDPAYRAAVVADRARIADNRLGDPAQAGELYMSALVLDPDLPGALEALKRESRSRGQWQRLVQTLEQEAARSTGSQVIAAALASIAAIHVEHLGQVADGIAALRSAVQHTPEDRTLWLRLADLHARSQEVPEEVECLRRVIEYTPEAPQRLALLDRMARRHRELLSDPEAAIACYRAALDIDPTHAPSRDGLLALHLAREDYAGVRALHERSLGVTSDAGERAALHHRIGQLLELRLSDPEGAVEHMRMALSIVPEHDAALRALDRLLSAQGRPGELVQVYEQAIEAAARPEAAIAHLMRMGGLREGPLDDPRGAMHCYQRVIDAAPGHLEAMYALQRVAARAGDAACWLGALDLELAQLQAGPRRTALLLQAALLLSESLDDPEAALARLLAVCEAEPGHPEALQRLAALYTQLGRWDALLHVHETRLASQQDPERRATLRFEMGMLAEQQLGDTEAATAHYDAALDAQPSHLPAHHALARLQRDAGDWKGLAQTLRRRLSASNDAATCAHLACELGELLEQRLDDTAGALRAHEQALQSVPAFRPSTDARLRLLLAAGRHAELAKACLHEADHAPDPASALDALMRAAAVQSDLLDAPDAAAEAYERVLTLCPGSPAALHALEVLYAGTGDEAGLERTYRALAATLTDTDNRVAVLRDLSRLIEAPAAVYAEIAHAAPQDIDALAGLSEATAEIDPQRHAACEQALSDSEQDRGLSAQHLVRVGNALCGADPAGALQAYRQALSLDPASLAATRGLSAAARALGDPDAMAEAARAEVEVTRDQPVAVGLYLEAASLERAAQNPAAAAAHAERALGLDPSHVQAAQQLTAILQGAGEIARLCDLLGRAARDGARGADLHAEVAQLRAEQLGDIPEAIAALRRALSCQPHHPVALALLPRHLEATGQWARAAEAYAQRLEHGGDAGVRSDTHLAIARIQLDHLDDPQRAQQHIQKVLSKQPAHRGALELKVRLLAERGDPRQALQVTQELLALADTSESRVAALMDVAGAQLRCELATEAADTLCEAIAIDGPEGEAARRYRSLPNAAVDWEKYVAALEDYLGAADSDAVASLTLRGIASAQSDGMRAPKRALATLEAGARDYPGDAPLWLAYARQLTLVDQADDAVEVYRRLIPRCPAEPSLWRGLSDAHRASGRTDEAVHSGLPMLLLDAASSKQLVELRGRVPNPRVTAGSLDDSTLAHVDREGVLERPATRLARTMGDVFARLHPLDLKQLGLSRRQRLQREGGGPLRTLADGLAAPLGIVDFDLYVLEPEGDAGAAGQVRLGLSDTPVLLVPRALQDAPTSVQRFELARSMFCLAQGLPVLEAAPAGRIATLMAGAIRRQAAGFDAPGIDAEAMDEAARVVGKALPWLGRSSVDDVAAAIGDGTVDLLAWVQDARQVAARAALLLADDLLPCLEQFRSEADDWSPFTDPSTVDLLRFWSGDAAVAHRHGG